jgi:hypothetical protein
MHFRELNPSVEFPLRYKWALAQMEPCLAPILVPSLSSMNSLNLRLLIYEVEASVKPAHIRSNVRVAWCKRRQLLPIDGYEFATTWGAPMVTAP